MTTRLSIDALAISAMLLMCAVLGLQQVALKSVAHDMSPVLQLAIRSGIAVVLLSLVMRWRQERLCFSDGTLLPGLLLGTLFSLEYLFLGEGLRYTSASRMVVFLYCSPLVTAAVLHYMRADERMTPLQWLGVLMAFTGLAVALMVPDEQADGAAAERLWGDCLGVLAGVAWGLSTVVVRTTCLADIPATRTLWYQLVTAFFLLLLAAVLLGQTQFTLTYTLLANLVFQGLVVAFASFLVWLMLLKRYVASQLGVLSFLTPIFGVAFGVILLDESLHGLFLVGAMMVITGIVLVSVGNQILDSLAR